MKLTIEFTTDNAAFDGDQKFTEVSRLLEQLVEQYKFFPVDDKLSLRDINGHYCGTAVWSV